MILCALSAAEATLAAAPLFDAADDARGDWPAQLTPVKDRDSASSRSVRPAEPQDDPSLTQRQTGGTAAFAPPSSTAHGLALTGLARADAPPSFVAALLPPHRLDLPPPMR